MGMALQETPTTSPPAGANGESVALYFANYHEHDRPMTALYQQDILAWARQQATLLRAGRFSELDIEHLAEEIEDVGKSE